MINKEPSVLNKVLATSGITSYLSVFASLKLAELLAENHQIVQYLLSYYHSEFVVWRVSTNQEWIWSCLLQQIESSFQGFFNFTAQVLWNIKLWWGTPGNCWWYIGWWWSAAWWGWRWFVRYLAKFENGYE